MARRLVDGVTVLGNLAIDVIDGGPRTPGGCASFAGAALAAAGGTGRIVALAAPADQALFVDLATGPFGDPAGPTISILDADRTSAFRLDYDDPGRDPDHRRVSVEAVGPVWDETVIDAADPDTTWVHLAPLLRTDFPRASLARLAARGHRVAYDGQGLVRADRLGPLITDGDYDAGVLRHVDVLKLDGDEAAVVAGGVFDATAARRLGVPEIVVTFGSRGCDVYAGGEVSRVPAAWPVLGVQTTGAGDVFTTAYAAYRAGGADPLGSARLASAVVARELHRRLPTAGAGRG